MNLVAAALISNYVPLSLFQRLYFSGLPLVCSVSSAVDTVTANQLTIRMPRRRIVDPPAFTLLTLFSFVFSFRHSRRVLVSLPVSSSPYKFHFLFCCFRSSPFVKTPPDDVSSPPFFGLLCLVFLMWLYL